MFVLGLDIGMLEVHARLLAVDPTGHPLPVGKPIAFPNTKDGQAALEKWLGQQGAAPSETHAVMEATGVYWQDYAYFLHTLKVTVSVVNPVQISLFARSLLTRAKTDKIDAMTIAKYGAVMRPKAWSPPEAAVETLKLLNHEREALVLQITRERNRQHALAHRHESNALIEQLHTSRVQQLQEQVRQLDEAIQSCLQGCTELEEQYKLLVSVPGVGRVTAVTLLAETEGFRNVASSRQLAAYAGIAPAPNQSGLMTRRSCISKVGNVRLRRSLYLAAVPATRTKTSLGTFYRRLRAAGKPPKVALVALARKILCIAFAVVRSQQPFDVDYGSARMCSTT